MPFSFCVLGSGSRGNCTLLIMGVRSRGPRALIDCGLSMRATAARLAPLGITLDDVGEVLLTHLDTDHFCPAWRNRIRRRAMTVYVHHRHRAAALRAGLDARCMHLFRGPFALAGGTSVEPVLLAHDALGSVGYALDHAGARLGYATDLGRPSAALLRRFTDLDALAIESNYDPGMQQRSGRPENLKRRIMGPTGHLSNEQSIDAVLRIARRSRLRRVVPLHLSRQCNAPRLVRGLYAARAPHLLRRLMLSSQDHPTPLIPVARGAPAPPGGQLAMFG